MFRYELRYYSSALNQHVAVPMLGPTLADAISQAFKYGVLGVANPKFGISLWVLHATPANASGNTQGELRLYNNQGTLPVLPHEGDWRRHALELMRNLDAQYRAQELEMQFFDTFDQVLNLMIVTNTVTPAEVEKLCIAAEEFRRIIFRHVKAIEFQGEVRDKLNALLRHMPPAIRDDAQL